MSDFLNMTKHGGYRLPVHPEQFAHAQNSCQSELAAHAINCHGILLAALEYSISQVPELGTVPGIASAIASAKGNPAVSKDGE